MRDARRGRRAREQLAAISGLDDAVRRSLYDYVCAQAGQVGRDEAAAAAGIGRPLAAYHLDRLVELGLLTAGFQRPAGRGGPGAGRPAKVYARSAREFAVTVPPREYELAARLMARAMESDPTGTTLAALRLAASQLGAELGVSCAGRSPAGPRQALVAALATHGFEPWTDDEGSIRLRNCPFHQLAARHRDVICGMNLALITGLARSLDPGSLHAQLDPGPGHCCVAVTVSSVPNPSRTGAS